jgi:single-strand DNA-binding protein
VTVWRRQAELASQYLSKGKQVYVEGRLIQKEFQDRDGNTRHSLEVTASDVQFLGSRGDDVPQSREETRSQPRVQEAAAAPVTEDDIPF